MKITRLLLCAVILGTTTLSKSQTYTYKDVNQLLVKAERDSVAYIERLAALEFHKLINQYRKENDLNEIKWNETLWIATINHNTWMDNASNLSHHQKSNTKYFTGISPGNRLDFAAGGDADISWSGENALYNYSSYGKSKEEIAKNIAQRSFNQWQNSPGHNKNMLGKSHGSHGVAFKITDGRVWGTDLFSSAGFDYTPSPSNYIAQKNTKTSRKKSKRFSTYKNKRIIQEELSNKLSDELSLKSKNWVKKEGEAKSKAYKIARKKYKTFSTDGVLHTETEITVQKRFFGLIKKQVHTYAATIETDLEYFDSKEISKELSELMKQNQPFNAKSKIDVAVVLKKKKNKVRVTLVSILYNPLKKS